MKIGKVSQTVLKRSMLKPLQFHREETMFAPSVEEMCYGVFRKENEEFISASSVLYGDEKDLGVFALAQVVNDLASRGAEAMIASVHIMLPPYAYESRLKAMVECVEQAGSAHGVQIACAKAEVSPVISKAADRKITPDTMVPIAVNTAVSTTLFFIFKQDKKRARKIKAVTGLSIIFGICPPGNPVVNAEMTPVTSAITTTC